MKIGIFGGTFDPIHNGHLYIAYEAERQLGLDKVIIIPSGTPPHKKSSKVTDANVRLEMVKIAAKRYVNFEVDDYEVKKEGRSYTCETLKHYREVYKDSELYFILGADSLINIDTWKNVDEIVSYATLIVFKRPGYKSSDIKDKIEEVEKKYGCKIIFLDLLNLEISSTDIKNRLNRHERVDFFMEDDVLKFINDKKIYSRK